MSSKFLLEDERRSVAAKLTNLAPDLSSRFETCQATHRFLSFKHKQLVIYNFLFERPSVVDTLTCQSASFDLDKGMSSTWVNGKDEMVEVSSSPVEVHPSIFLWHTFSSEVVYQEHKGAWSARFSMLYSVPQHPKYRVEGVLYMQEKASFQAEFKQQ